MDIKEIKKEFSELWGEVAKENAYGKVWEFIEEKLKQKEDRKPIIKPIDTLLSVFEKAELIDLGKVYITEMLNNKRYVYTNLTEREIGNIKNFYKEVRKVHLFAKEVKEGVGK